MGRFVGRPLRKGLAIGPNAFLQNDEQPFKKASAHLTLGAKNTNACVGPMKRNTE